MAPWSIKEQTVGLIGDISLEFYLFNERPYLDLRTPRGDFRIRFNGAGEIVSILPPAPRPATE